MTWPEKEKKIRIFVWCLTGNTVDHLAIRHSGRSDMSARNEDKWKTNFMTLRINNQNYRGKAYFQCTIDT